MYLIIGFLSLFCCVNIARKIMQNAGDYDDYDYYDADYDEDDFSLPYPVVRFSNAFVYADSAKRCRFSFCLDAIANGLISIT